MDEKPTPAPVPAPASWADRALMVVALMFIAGESAVQLGFKLPLSDVVPEWASGLLGVLLMAGGAYFRAKLAQLVTEKPDAR